MSKRYLIIGGNGLVGKSFRKLLKNDEVFYTSREASGAQGQLQCDLLDRESIRQAFEASRPDVVINCANLAGGVDFCEANPGMSRKFHAEGTRMLGEESLKYNAAFVFISTDYVFDGSQPPYTEEDLPNPLNVYGKNKLEAEEWIKNNLSNYVIARTTNVYGWDPHTTTPNFLMGLFFRLSRNEAVSVPAYLYGTPTLADDLAIVITELLQAGKSGLFHITGPDLVSRYEWAAGFCSVMNLPLPLLKKADVPPANMVPRPFRSHLISRKLDLTLRKKLNGVSNGLSLFRKEYEKHS